MSKKTEWEEKLADIEVTLRSPDGDESWAESISQIEEYDELKSFIQDLLAKEKMELVKRIEEAVCNPDWDRDRSVAGIIIYLKALKSELQEEVGG